MRSEYRETTMSATACQSGESFSAAADSESAKLVMASRMGVTTFVSLFARGKPSLVKDTAFSNVYNVTKLS